MLFDQETIELIASVIEKEGSLDLPAYGNSMYPLIQKGDICTFHVCNPDMLKKGDIALFHTSTGQLVAHRFFETTIVNRQPYFLFKGDTNLGFDEPISKNQLIGKLASIQKARTKVCVEDLPSFIWKKMILALPMISALLRSYLNLKSRQPL